jgi:hypothetical protein
MEKDNFQLEQTLSIVTVSAVAQTAPTLEQVPGHDNAAQLGVIFTQVSEYKAAKKKQE